jgi:osmoprotectant transport system permease protein
MDLFGEAIAWLTQPDNWTDPRNGILLRLWEHVTLAAFAIAAAVAIALPIGIWIGHTGRWAGGVIAVTNIGRAIPSVGWLGIVFPLTLVLLGRNGIGFVPAAIALTALAIPPIVTNAYAGMREVDADLVEAGRGMGMREMEVVRRVEVPVAMPVILAGIRISAVQVVATATLAAIVGGGTLGHFIVQGIFVRALDRVVGAAILVALLAILTELIFSFIERRAVSQGLRDRARVSPMEPGQVGLPGSGLGGLPGSGVG